MRTIFAAAAIITSLLSTAARSQVNTESLRRDELAPGIYNKLSVNVDFAAGNRDYVGLGGRYRLDVVGQNLYAFLVSRYDRRTNDGEIDLNEGFAHARLIYLIDSTFRPEIFVQKEFNDFILLRDRSLAGGGLRVQALSARDSSLRLVVHVGAGLMYEAERISSEPEQRTQLVRSTNYVSAFVRAGTTLSFNITGYYQTAVEHMQDFRILTEGEASFAISDVLAFTVGARYRYDNEPPPEVRKFDLRLTNGLTVAF